MEDYIMELKELYTKRATAWEAAKKFLDTHRTEDGTMSAEDGAVYDRMEKEITDLTHEIERSERLAEMEKKLAMPTSKPLTGKPGAGADDKPLTGRASHQYAVDFLTAMRTDFHQVSNVLEEGNDANGGYLVPEEWDSRLIDKLDESNIFRPLATVIKTSGERKINIAATKPAAAWIEEGEALTFGDATFDQVVLDAHKLHVAVKITEELLYDSAFPLENYIIDQFGKALGNAEEDAFLNGDGQGKPLGIFADKGGGEKAVEIAAGKLTGDDILTLIYSLKRPYRQKASFILNDQTLAALRKLKDNNQAYIWQPSYQAGEPDRLCGYSIHTSAYCPTLEAGKSGIAFGDFSYYNIGDRGVRSFQQLRELFAGNGMVGYVAKERVDGKLVLPEAVQILSVKASA
jgi:HK97 family phage major capsid protein